MMPFFVNAFVGATQGWTAAETGAYFLLLGAEWEMGPLPTDTTALANISRMTVKDFKVAWKKISKKFRTSAEGLVNDRLEEHRRRSLELHQRHRLGAQQTNRKRWGTVVSIAERVAERDGERSLSVSHTSTSTSTSPQRLTKGESFESREDLEGRSPNSTGDGDEFERRRGRES